MAARFEHLLAGVDLLGSNYGFADPDNEQGVLGYGYGWIRREGRWTQDLGLVLLVRQGAPGFPYAHVRVDAFPGPADVPCCAFILSPQAVATAPARAVAGSPNFCIGAPLSPRPALAIGTAAGAVDRGQRLLVTARHVLDLDPDSANVYCGDVVVGHRRASRETDEFYDLAFIAAAEAVSDQALGERADSVVLGDVAAVGWDDFDAPASVYRPTTGETMRPFILAAGMTLHLFPDSVGGRRTQTGMIMTEACSGPGDSGTGLVGSSGALLGALSHGREEFSFFTEIAAARRAGHWPEEDT